MADGASVETERWQAGFDDVISRIAGRFSRVEPRRRAAAFLRGLMAGLPRVNCWTLAEQAGEATPDGMQHLLARAVWDERAVQGDLRDYVVQALGETDGVLIVDETGDVKKGTGTVGVQRQYTGTAGRIENAQVGVYLVYATRRGYAFLDRALYLPTSWTDDPARCTAAGVPTDVEFATKPALARTMITAALDAGVPARWVTGDEVYGADSRLRADLITRGVGYVLAVAKTHRILTGIGTRRAIDLAVRLPAHAWFRQSAGPGAKGPRIYDWACVQTTDPAADRTTGTSLWGCGRGAWAADPTEHPHEGTGVLPGVLPDPGPPERLGSGRRHPVEDRGILPIRQRTHRPGRTPSPHLDVLAPLDRPGHARPRLPVRHDRHHNHQR